MKDFYWKFSFAGIVYVYNFEKNEQDKCEASHCDVGKPVYLTSSSMRQCACLEVPKK